MIKGIGTDITDVARFKRAMKSKKFMDIIFTEKEQKILKKPESFAGSFAAKESAAKAMGTGFSGFFPNCIEILRDENLKPYAVLHGKAKETADNLKITRIHVSISHEKDKAIAFAIAEEI